MANITCLNERAVCRIDHTSYVESVNTLRHLLSVAVELFDNLNIERQSRGGCAGYRHEKSRFQFNMIFDDGVRTLDQMVELLDVDVGPKQLPF